MQNLHWLTCQWTQIMLIGTQSRLSQWLHRNSHNERKTHKSWTSNNSSNHRIWSKKVTVDGHRLVAEKYLPNPNNYPQVDHINRVRHDNRVENLRWVTRQENCENRIFGGTEQQAIEYLQSLGYTITKWLFWNPH